MPTTPAKKAPAKKAGLTDKKLADLGRAYETTRLRMTDMKTEMEGYKKTILDELTRRKTKAVENSGVKVTKVEQPHTTYSYDELEEAIGKKEAKRYRPRAVDVAELSRAVQAGKVPASVIDDITEVTKKAPYVSVSFTQPSK